MGQWYYLIGKEGHVGTGKCRDVELAIYAEDIVHCLAKYKKINRIKSRWTPDITALSHEDGIGLEAKIIKEGRVSLYRAKKDYYLLPNSHEMIVST